MGNEELLPQNRKCFQVHKINGHIPLPTDLHLKDMTCECGKLIFRAVPCGCPNNPHDDLKSFPNENYIPQ
jgi:hypothetical protein